jgi:hypothetical protein
MRFILVLSVLFVAARCQGAEDAIKANGTLNGKKVQFPAKSLTAGVKATVDLLGSCADESVYTDAQLKKAEQADHIRLLFAKPIRVTVMNEQIAVSELVFSQPMNTAVFWVRAGNKIRRYSKFEFSKQKPFEVWLRQAKGAD